MVLYRLFCKTDSVSGKKQNHTKGSQRGNNQGWIETMNRIRYVTCWEFKDKVHLEIDGGKISDHRICLG